jgi:hypothetical protein
LDVWQRPQQFGKAQAMSELDEIKRFGGKPQRNSGRGVLQKGDAILEPFLVDVKEYDESFSVSRTVWAKLQADAFKAQHRQPAFMLALGSKETAGKLRVWVISDTMFKEMLQAWQEKNSEGGVLSE